MQGKKKQFIIGAAVLAIVCLAYFAATLLSKDEEAGLSGSSGEGGDAPKPVTIDGAKAAAITVNGREGSFTLLREGEGWSMEGDSGFSVGATLVDSFVKSLNDMYYDTRIDKYEGLSDYGLDSGESWVSVRMEDGSAIDIRLGNKNDLTGSYYIMVSGDENVYVVPEYALQLASVTKDYFESHEDAESREGADGDAEAGADAGTDDGAEAGQESADGQSNDAAGGDTQDGAVSEETTP